MLHLYIYNINIIKDNIIIKKILLHLWSNFWTILYKILILHNYYTCMNLYQLAKLK